MMFLRNRKFVAAIVLVAIGVVLLLVWAFRVPSHELTRAEFDQLLKGSPPLDWQVIPTPYAGIYEFESKRKAGPRTERVFITTPVEETQLQKLFQQKGVQIHLPGQSARIQLVNIISSLVIGAVVITLIAYQYRLGRGKDAKVRKSPNVSFRDVAGIDEAKSEVQEIVDFLRDPKKFKRLGGNLPKGVLLIGPPGTGKTMLAKAIACEAKANFFSAHGSDFTEVFVGVGAKRVRQLFRQAAKNKPAIVFIDEIDCVGKNSKFDTHG